MTGLVHAGDDDVATAYHVKYDDSSEEQDVGAERIRAQREQRALTLSLVQPHMLLLLGGCSSDVTAAGSAVGRSAGAKWASDVWLSADSGLR